MKKRPNATHGLKRNERGDWLATDRHGKPVSIERFRFTLDGRSGAFWRINQTPGGAATWANFSTLREAVEYVTRGTADQWYCPR